MQEVLTYIPTKGDQLATENVNERPTFDFMDDTITMAVIIVMTVLTLVLVFYGQFVKKDGGQYSILITLTLSVLDLVTDILFSMQALADFKGTDSFWIPVVFILTLVITALISIPILVKFVMQELECVDFKDWFVANRVGCVWFEKGWRAGGL